VGRAAERERKKRRWPGLFYTLKRDPPSDVYPGPKARSKGKGKIQIKERGKKGKRKGGGGDSSVPSRRKKIDFSHSTREKQEKEEEKKKIREGGKIREGKGRRKPLKRTTSAYLFPRKKARAAVIRHEKEREKKVGEKGHWKGKGQS